MFQSIMPRVNDGHALGGRVDGIVMTDISGNQHLCFLLQGIADHAAACPRRYRHTADRTFCCLTSVDQHKRKFKCLFHLFRKRIQGDRLCQNTGFSDSHRHSLHFSGHLQRLPVPDSQALCCQICHAAWRRVKVGMHGHIGNIRLQ